MTSVTLVVRSLNEERHIGRLLSGAMRQTLRPSQIILVDSGSTDATLEIASRYPVEVKTIDPAQFSFGRSLNTGCSAASGEILVIASAHVYPIYDTWLAELVAPFTDERVALSYGRQIGGTDTKYSERRILAQWFPVTSSRAQEHPFCNNANAAVRRALWQQRPYNETVTGLEDLEWAKWASEQGWQIAYVAEAPVAHEHDESWGQIANRYRREAIAHKRIYHDNRMGAPEALRLTAASIANDYVHAVRDGALAHNLWSIPAFRVAQFWGTYRGFRQRGEASAALRRHFYYPRGWRRASDQPATTGQRIEYETEHDGPKHRGP
jgi:GT2 family glycosyltransferase